MRLCVLSILLALAAPAAAGELSDFDIDEKTRWKPTAACVRPTPPSVGAIDNAVERNRAVRDFNDYAQRINEYLTCTVEEANRDLVTFRKIVSDSLEAEKAEMKTESEQLKATIEAGGNK
jgi:hypothetical protein